MKKCTYCGQQNNDASQFCVNCGSKFETQGIINQTNEEQLYEVKVEENVVKEASLIKKEENSLATVSLILGLISIGCLLIFTMIPFGTVISLFALTTGIIAIVRKPKIAKQKAIFGIIAGSIVFILCIVIFIVAGPVIEMVKEFLNNYCHSNSNSDECLMLEELLPNLFS